VVGFGEKPSAPGGSTSRPFTKKYSYWREQTDVTSVEVLVGASLVIVLTLAAALALRWRNRVDCPHDETPEDRYRREIPYLRRGSQT
jgi:hypothetical protein